MTSGTLREKGLHCVSNIDIEAALTLQQETKSKQQNADKQTTTLSLEHFAGKWVQLILLQTEQQQP